MTIYMYAYARTLIVVVFIIAMFGFCIVTTIRGEMLPLTLPDLSKTS